MKEAYVKFETAKLLREKGFDWECYGHYNLVEQSFDECSVNIISHTNKNSTLGPFWISAPTQQMACRWLCEEKGIHPELELCTDNEFSFTIYKLDGKRTVLYEESRCWTKLEDAVEAALEYVLTELI